MVRRAKAKSLIAYYRVSTKGQGESGLDLEGQKAAVEAYAHALGVPILRAYREVENGGKVDRPELTKAIAHTRRGAQVRRISARRANAREE